jgi:hypothetical protein
MIFGKKCLNPLIKAEKIEGGISGIKGILDYLKRCSQNWLI